MSSSQDLFSTFKIYKNHTNLIIKYFIKRFLTDKNLQSFFFSSITISPNQRGIKYIWSVRVKRGSNSLNYITYF